jgi:broad specificity phosphatase PhoE
VVYSPRNRLPLSVDLLRHGQVATPSLFSAPFEEPLGMEGWKQLTLATQDTEWDVVIAPPIRRCHDFARLLAQRLSCEFRVDERFCELDFGEWVGLSQQEIMARDPELLQQYYFQPRRFHAPGGESMELFMERVHQGWENMLTSCAGKRVLILTHTGVIRVVIGKALDLLYQKTLRFEVDYARFSRFSVYPDGEIVLSGHGLANVKNCGS